MFGLLSAVEPGGGLGLLNMPLGDGLLPLLLPGLPEVL
jgi:hypothetical protein